VLDNVTTDPAATFELSRKNLLTTSFYYTQGNGDISLDHQLRLDIVATMMIDNPNLIAYISGYSDSTGSTAGNLKLSQIRVDKLSGYLTSKGVPADQFRLAVIGEEQPVGDNATESGRALNRRVDIQFDGLGQGL
jgi:outer membrane protein OmpA-like peptidoglycan-associated protein